MTAQFPTFRLTVAQLMEGYSHRLAKRIDNELQRRGEDHNDLAHALRVNPRTAERWVHAEVEPQRRFRKPIADYLGVPIEELWPDLEAEEKALRDQLDRIESKLDALGVIEAKVDVVLRLLLDVDGPAEVLEAEVARVREQRTQSAARSRRRTQTRKAS